MFLVLYMWRKAETWAVKRLAIWRQDENTQKDVFPNHNSLYYRRSTGSALWTPPPSTRTPSKRATPTEPWFSNPNTPHPKNLGVWAANLQNLKTQRLEPQSRLLAGTLENLPKEKKEPLKSEKRTQTCPTFWLCHVWIVTQSSHDCILLANVWWLGNHYRIIIWSRLDVIKKMNCLLLPLSIYIKLSLLGFGEASRRSMCVFENNDKHQNWENSMNHWVKAPSLIWP